MDDGQQHLAQDAASLVPEPSSASTFADLARELQSPETERATMHAVLELARELLHAEHAGFTTQSRGRFRTVAATSDVALRVDDLQYALDEGPCVGVIEESITLRSKDIEVDARWPRFGPQAAGAAGIHSMLSHRLFVEGDTIGALNLYSSRIGAFGEDEERTGKTFATHAALALRAARAEDRARNLAVALESNRKIGTAVGILMARNGLTEHDSFELLRRYSQHHNIRIGDLAERVTYTGDLNVTA